MGISPFTSSGAATVDEVLGNAYQIVKHVYDKLDDVTSVAEIRADVELIAANLEAAAGAIVANHAAIILAGVANYRATFAEALTDFVDGEYFTTAETGALRLYKRQTAAPGYVDQGDVVAPVSRTFLASTAAAAAIGTAEADTNLQEALDARPTSVFLALEGAAALLGASDPDGELSNVQQELDARPTAADLALPAAGGTIGTNSPAGATVNAALTNALVAFHTQAQLVDVTHAVNTTGKFLGKMVWNTDTNRLVIAQGAGAGNVWRSAEGTDIITPL